MPDLPKGFTRVATGTGDMSLDWDARAKDNYRFYIDTGNWKTEEEFDANGKHDVETIVLPALELVKNRDRMLEIGAGAGRMTVYLSGLFKRVYAVDCSRIMLEKLQERLRGIENVISVHNDGIRLPVFLNGLMDYVLCYAVLDHIPKREYLIELIKNIHSVLIPGGIATVELGACGWVKNDLQDNAGTWRGVVWSQEGFKDMLRKVGFEIAIEHEDNEESLWILMGDTVWSTEDLEIFLQEHDEDVVLYHDEREKNYGETYGIYLKPVGRKLVELFMSQPVADPLPPEVAFGFTERVKTEFARIGHFERAIDFSSHAPKKARITAQRVDDFDDEQGYNVMKMRMLMRYYE
jgi:SAM-dependent methyltransferase